MGRADERPLRELTAARALVHSILVVEDEPDTATFLKNLLEENSYRVTIAKDGGQAHASFVMHKPDFVILDLILPGESGFEVCERMKEHDQSVPVLILTAIDMQDARDLATRVGADGFLEKPFDPNELLAQIESLANTCWERQHADQKKPEGVVRFQCQCGKKFKVSVSHVGKSMTCPECTEPVVVPKYS
ncbi:MAG: hypothetical protein Tsb009_21850 [Planctomycetaceae bacterium]